MGSHQGKTVLVTGGSSGIGAAAARVFAREGARVVIAARGIERGEAVAEEIRDAGGDAFFIRADVAVAADVAKLVADVVSRHGRLDAAFNNAAGVTGIGLTADFSEEDFDRSIASNLKSVWLCMKHEITQMMNQTPRGGAIVNTSSVNGLGGALRGSLYSAAKAGVLALTKSAAREYAIHGIRVNALVPAAFRTPMLENAIALASEGKPERVAEVEARYAQLSPFGRIGRPEEAAEAAVWLCSDAASFVTGLSMIVDGGMTASVR